MKILFVGPTLHGLVRDGRLDGAPGLVCRPPARQGDLLAAVEAGATAIGLVDGRFDDVAAPWHKEILHAIAVGCRVYGAGSLGALRAAECAAFGMIGVGAIFEAYARGDLVDDSDVAQVHGPEELDHVPLSEPRVNVRATLAALADAGRLDAERRARLAAAAERVHFADLSLAGLPAAAGFDDAEADDLAALLTGARIDAKRRDALALVERLCASGDDRAPPPAWTMAEPVRWRRFRAAVARSADRGAAM